VWEGERGWGKWWACWWGAVSRKEMIKKNMRGEKTKRTRINIFHDTNCHCNDNDMKSTYRYIIDESIGCVDAAQVGAVDGGGVRHRGVLASEEHAVPFRSLEDRTRAKARVTTIDWMIR